MSHNKPNPCRPASRHYVIDNMSTMCVIVAPNITVVRKFALEEFGRRGFETIRVANRDDIVWFESNGGVIDDITEA